MTTVVFMNVLRRTPDAVVITYDATDRGRAGPHPKPVDSTMIAMSLMHQDLPKQPQAPAAVPDGKRADVPSGKPAIASAPFQPLDPGVLNASIPAFVIGRNRDGFWLAREIRGRTGGIFLLRSSALAFARRNSFPLGCATIFPAERFELDLENRGNPLLAYLGPLMRLAMRGWDRMAILTGRIAEAAERRR